MLLLALIILLVTVVPDIIIWNGIFPSPDGGWKWMLCIPTVAVFCLMGAAMAVRKERGRIVQLFIGVMLFLIIPKLVFSVIAWPFGWPAGMAAAAIVITLFTYGSVIGWLRMTVREETLAFPDLPEAFDDYRILQISDLHIGTFTRHPEFIKKMVRTANSLNPDLIVFTGDLINMRASEIMPFTQILTQLEAKDGVLSILGNHDYMDYYQTINTEITMGWDGICC